MRCIASSHTQTIRCAFPTLPSFFLLLAHRHLLRVWYLSTITAPFPVTLLLARSAFFYPSSHRDGHTVLYIIEPPKKRLNSSKTQKKKLFTLLLFDTFTTFYPYLLPRHYPHTHTLSFLLLSVPLTLFLPPPCYLGK
ncbi:hypothetical protein R3P38DRAFT_659445 [Favolaschia claudopus]|uniref:Uncharacterized protein n=1 Tax=Favolaschia claudopus TaxID=2862362 RepID=A0AAW0ECQ7_9AGAR